MKQIIIIFCTIILGLSAIIVKQQFIINEYRATINTINNELEANALKLVEIKTILKTITGEVSK